MNASTQSQLEALHHFSMQMASMLDLGDVLEQLCSTAFNLSACQGCAVYLHSLEEGRVRLESSNRLSGAFMASNRSFLFLPGGRAQCLSTGHSFLVPDLGRLDDKQDNLEAGYLESLRNEGILAFGDFPLVALDGAIGYLTVYYGRPHTFDPTEIQLLEVIAALGAVSISNVRLHARTDPALARRIHQLSILESVSRQLAEAIQSDRLFEMILNYAVEFTDANWGSIGLLNPPVKRVTVKAWRGYTQFPPLLNAADGLVGKAIQSQQTVNSGDVSREREFIDLTGGEARSHLSVPILHASKLLGVISLESAHPEAFSPADEMFISQLALQAGVATELYNSVQTRELITETLVHDIRSPVTAMLGALEVIEDTANRGEESRPADASQKVIDQALGVARQGAFRVLGLIESLLDIARFQSGNIEIFQECVRLQPLVEDVFRQFEAQSNDYQVALLSDLPTDLPDLFVDISKVTRVLSNLVDNALKFSPEGGQVIVQAAEHSQDEVLIQVIDYGPGIPDDYREQIFERFTQIPGLQGRRRGTGLGLTFCRLAVEAHGGRIWVESNPQGGSNFNLTLPSMRRSGDVFQIPLS